jgi:hypothetical protein
MAGRWRASRSRGVAVLDRGQAERGIEGSSILGLSYPQHSHRHRWRSEMRTTLLGHVKSFESLRTLDLGPDPIQWTVAVS